LEEIETNGGSTVTYDFYLGIEADPSLQQSGLYNGWEVYNSNTSVASATSYGGNLFYIDERIDFERNTTYYWKVVAKVSDGTEITSSVYSFTTGGWNKLPGKPVITSPANNATDVFQQDYKKFSSKHTGGIQTGTR
jgi:hypothetical protein